MTTIQNVAVGYVCFWTTSPIIAYSTSARIFAVLAVAIWAGLEITRPRGILWRPTLPVLLMFVYIVYTGSIEFMLTGAGGLIQHLQIWIMLFFLIVHQSRRKNLQSLVPVFWFVLATLPIWQFLTIGTIATENAHAARVLVRSSAEAQELAAQGVGGYGLVYGTLLLLPGLIVMALNGLRLDRARLPWPLRTVPKLAYALVLVNISLGIFLLLTAGFSLAVIALAGILFPAVFLKSYSAPRLLLTVLATLVVVMLALPLLGSLLSALLPLAEGTNFANKIRDVQLSLQLGEMMGTAGDRFERYARSLRLFAENPLIGVLAVDDVGKHSEVLDNYARWGVIYGSIFVYLIAFLPVRAMLMLRDNFGAPLAMLAAIVVVFGLNSGFANAGVMIFLMFPVAAHLLAGMERRSPRPVAAVRHA